MNLQVLEELLPGRAFARRRDTAREKNRQHVEVEERGRVGGASSSSSSSSIMNDPPHDPDPATILHHLQPTLTQDDVKHIKPG